LANGRSILSTTHRILDDGGSQAIGEGILESDEGKKRVMSAKETSRKRAIIKTETCGYEHLTSHYYFPTTVFSTLPLK